ncbi:MAG: PQQ-dependent sugar dehydrogenase [Longimicrobiales bacterium]|nr:PQQ-dependent sugar dehydrogenase [Longimicrobiales bacterium]
MVARPGSPTSWPTVAGTLLLAGIVLSPTSVPAQQAQSDDAEPPAAGQREAAARAQRPNVQWDGVPPPVLPDEQILHTAHEPNIRVRVLVRGLSHPWSLAFLPNGDMLVTERDGRLRVIRDGVLDPEPVSGVPEVFTDGAYAGLMEVVLHPNFEDNGWIYLTYITADEGNTVALARARFDGSALHDLREIFRAAPDGIRTSGSRLLFAPDETLFMPVGGAFDYQGAGNGLRAQDPALHAGKILRLRDDGTVPDDNPFVDQPEYRPEIYSLGHRNPMGLAFHPETGELWAVEHAPQGGDEVNVIRPGKNYGWPVVSYGRLYSGVRVSDRPWQEGMEQPLVVWLPSVATSGMTFYTGDAFPAWRGNLFVGSLMEGRIRRTGHLERVVFNWRQEEIARESLLTELGQRIRDVRQGPDGLLYLLTEEEDAVLMRIEPVGKD